MFAFYWEGEVNIFYYINYFNGLFTLEKEKKKKKEERLLK
jgi:hypothetical protein